VPSAANTAAAAAAVALVLQHAQAMEELEAAAATEAAAVIEEQLAQLQREYAAQWVMLAGALTATMPAELAADMVAWLVRALARIPVDLARMLTGHARRARRLAREQVAEELTADEEPDPDTAGGEVDGEDDDTPAPDDEGDDEPLPAVVADIIDQADQRVRDHLDKVAEQARQRPPETFDAAATLLAETRKAATSAETTARQVVNTTANETIRDTAKQLDANLLWIAERDACVHCLAYSGLVGGAWTGFPLGRTYGKKPLVPWPDPDMLPCPPLHPNCRCRVKVWFTQRPTTESPVTMPQALRREAERSILKGWRVESEPEKVRVQAAADLLQRGLNPMIAASVRDYGRRSVRRGKFPTRRVPKFPTRP
jgi:hypothetical protein